MRSPIKASLPRKPPSQFSSPHPLRRTQFARIPAAALSVVVVVLLALFAQLLAPQLPHSILRLLTRDHPATAGITLRNPIVLQQPPTCPRPKPHVEFVGTFNTRPERSMALAERAKRVAAEFDFGPDAVNKAVTEFIREMGRWRCDTRCDSMLTARRRGPGKGGH